VDPYLCGRKTKKKQKLKKSIKNTKKKLIKHEKKTLLLHNDSSLQNRTTTSLGKNHAKERQLMSLSKQQKRS